MPHHASHRPTLLRRCVRELLRRPPAALAMLGAPGLALAGPAGEDVIRGAADITRPDANNTVINQYTDRAVINWQSFNVDADEYVLFNQPGTSSIVLNRVLGGDPTHILGQVHANGQVFLLNPQGVFITEGATLDVQGFLGATLDMDPDAFMAGDFTLTRSDASPMSTQVINNGTITAGPGGYVLLAGDFTDNTGIITANAGTVALVSGNALTLDIQGDGLVNFAVNEATLAEHAGVRNAGSLIADGGMVVMTAKVASDLVATAVNNEGLVRAHAIEERNGEIWLVGHGGDVVNAGTLDADGENADGGTIIAYTDRDMTLADGAVQTAAGDENHSGGFMRFIAENRLDYRRDNVIRATGGVSGGFVEVSGHGSINLMGIPEIGAGGQLWIDPQHIAIQSGSGTAVNDPNTAGSPATFLGATPSYVGASEDVTFIGANYIAGQLSTGVDVTLVASEAIFVDAIIPVTINATGGGNLNFQIGSVSTGTGVYFGTTVPTITPSADPDPHQLDLGNLDVSINGSFSANAPGGDITFGNISATGNIAVTGGNVTVGAVSGNGAVNAVTLTGSSTAAGRGNVTLGTGGLFGSTIGSLTITANGGANGGNVSINGQTIRNQLTINANSAGGTNGGVITVGNASYGITDAAYGANASFNGNLLNAQNAIYFTGLVTINSNVTGSVLQIGDSFAAPAYYAQAVTINGSVNVSGDVSIWTDDLSNADITITGAVSAGGNVLLHAQGSSGAAPAISIGGMVSAGNNIDMTAIGTSIGGGGNINIGSGAIATGGVTMTANANGGNNGGNITIAAGGISGGGLVNLSATGGTSWGGNIDVTGAGPKGITGNGVTLFASGSGIASVNPNATITVSGQIQGGTGAVSLSAIQTGGGEGGFIDIQGNGSAGVIRGQSVSLNATAAGFGINPGRIELGSGSAEVNFTGAQVIAQSGNINVNVSGSNGVFVAGDLSAAGGVMLNNAGGQGHIHLGDYTGGALVNPGGITAGGNVDIFASGSSAAVDGGDINAQHINIHAAPTAGASARVVLGNLQASGTAPLNRDVVVAIDNGSGSSTGTISLGNVRSINGDVSVTIFDGPGGIGSGNDITTGNIEAATFARIATRGNITTGGITVTNTAAPVSVDLRAFTDSFTPFGGDITVNGNIAASGRAANDNPFAAGIFLETLPSGGHTITVNGSITVSGTARAFSNSDTGSTGSLGIGNIAVRTGDGAVNLGNLNVAGAGEGWLEVQAAAVSLGDVTMNVTNGAYARTYALGSTECMTTCSLTVQENLISGGRAEININNAALPPSLAAATFGNVNVTAPQAHVSVTGFGDISGGGIAVNASGAHFELASTGTYEGAAVNATEVSRGGGASVYLEGSSGGLVRLNDAVALSGRGLAEFTVHAGTIKVRSVSAEASAGTFERTGPASPLHDGPFDSNDGDGPRIDEGTIKGGFALITLDNGSTPSAIDVTGNLSVEAAGPAHIDINGGGVNITGDISAVAGAMLQDGSYSRTWFDSSLGSNVTESGTVTSAYANAGIDINATGNLAAGNINLQGPGIGGDIEAANLQIGNLSAVAGGGSLDVDETVTYDNGTVVNRSLDGPGLLSGVGIFADNTAVTGAISIDAVGAGGMLLGGTAIETGSISIDVTDGSYAVLAPNVLGTSLQNFTAGNVIFGIVGATAQVNGGISLAGSQGVHFGGNANVSGSVDVTAGGSITPTVPATVRALNSLDDPDSGGEIAVPGTLGLNATGIRFESGGNLVLNGADLRAGEAIALAATGNMAVSGVTFNAGTLEMTAGGNIRNSSPAGSITAGAAAIAAGRTVDLSNTTLVIGSNHIATVTGDERFLDLLANEGLNRPDGGPNLAISGRNVSLGALNFAGDYLFLQANTLTLAGAISTSDPNLLVQLAPLATGGAFSLEQSTPGGGDTKYVYDGALAEFGAATIALGTTAHTGNVGIGANSEFVDIGATNLFVLTSGTVTGLDRVLSTGVVKDLATLLGLGFDVPQTDEIDVNQNPVQSLSSEYGVETPDDTEEEDEGDEEGEDTDTDADVEEEDDSLIRRDTADEELMCRS